MPAVAIPASLPGQAHRATESLHALIYFAPEADEEFARIGLDPDRMAYFASRSAPMGAVSAAVTTATFYNFNPDLIARHIPAAWARADVETILDARLVAADRALRRLLGADALASPELAELTGLAAEACTALPVEGRPLFAGHAARPWPGPVHLRLWHAATLLREYRGDGHVMALQDAGLTGIESIYTHTATGRGFTVAAAQQLRGWSPAQWEQARIVLADRGLVGADGQLTAAGIAQREEVEARTDRLDTAAWTHLGLERSARLVELGKRFARVVVGNGAFATPGVFAGGA